MLYADRDQCRVAQETNVFVENALDLQGHPFRDVLQGKYYPVTR